MQKNPKAKEVGKNKLSPYSPISHRTRRQSSVFVPQSQLSKLSTKSSNSRGTKSAAALCLKASNTKISVAPVKASVQKYKSQKKVSVAQYDQNQNTPSQKQRFQRVTRSTVKMAKQQILHDTSDTISNKFTQDEKHSKRNPTAFLFAGTPKPDDPQMILKKSLKRNVSVELENRKLNFESGLSAKVAESKILKQNTEKLTKTPKRGKRQQLATPKSAQINGFNMPETPVSTKKMKHSLRNATEAKKPKTRTLRMKKQNTLYDQLKAANISDLSIDGNFTQKSVENGHSLQTPVENGHSVQTPTENGHSDQTPTENGHSDQTPTENGHSVQTPVGFNKKEQTNAENDNSTVNGVKNDIECNTNKKNESQAKKEGYCVIQ